MEKLLNLLGFNSKVDKITSKLVPSLDDTITYDYAKVVVKSNKNIIEQAKSMIIKPTDNPDIFRVSFLSFDDPRKGVLKDFYEANKAEEYIPASYAHGNPKVVVNVDTFGVHQVLNWLYSSKN